MYMVSVANAGVRFGVGRNTAILRYAFYMKGINENKLHIWFCWRF